MRILMLNYEFPPLGGGASPVSYDISKGLVKQGHSVDVVTMGYKNLPKFENVNGIRVFRVTCLRSKKEICHPWEQASYLISAKLFLKKHLKKNKYDICHTHFIIPTGPLALWLKKKFKINYIITSHGSDVLGYNKRFKRLYPLLKKPWKKIIKEASLVTTPSQFLQDEIKKVTKAGNLKVVPNGIYPGHFKPMKKEKYILCVSRLFENKGIQDLLHTLKDFDLKGWKVKIVGDGPYKTELEKIKKKLKLKNVEFLGWIDNKSDKLKELYGKASIFVSPSHFESFGMCALEAISSGCYPLLSNIGGHRFIINKDKYFFKKNNIKELRKKLNELISFKKIDNNFDVSKFDWKNINKQFENIYETYSRNIDVIFIAGSSYSGSTLLGLILGSNREVFNCGEISKYEEIKKNIFKMDRERKINNFCTCGKKYDQCKFWSKVYSSFNKNVDFNPNPGFSFQNIKLGLKIILPFVKLNLKKEAKDYNELLKYIKQFKNKPGYILDNSKSVYNLCVLNNCNNVNLKVIFLTRNGLETINSFKKHKLGTFYGLFSWILVNTYIKICLYKFKINHITLSYGDLCKKQKHYFKKIGKFLNINLNHKNYVDNINNEKFHIIAGNPFLNNKNSFKGIIHEKNTKFINIFEKPIIKIITLPFDFVFKKLK